VFHEKTKALCKEDNLCVLPLRIFYPTVEKYGVAVRDGDEVAGRSEASGKTEKDSGNRESKAFEHGDD
jgi:hypothetical protein